MGIGGFLSSIGDGAAHGLEHAVEGLNVVDRYINPFHEEQTLTPNGQAAAEEAAKSGHPQQQGALAPSLEDTMSGMRWLYSNGISQPIATASLVGKMNRGNNSAFGGDYFNTHAWTKAWHAANHISMGQAMVLSPDEAQQAIDSPLLYYKPPDSYLPPGFKDLPEDQQQKILHQAGMPAIGNAFIEKQRKNSAWFKYGTGAIDFGSVMFLDPTSLAMGGVGKIHSLAMIKKMPKGGWSTAEIDSLVSSSRVKTLMEGIWANKDNPQLLNNTAIAQHSGMGPRFGNIASKLQSPEEVELFVRTGMGDARAMEELTRRNAAAGLRIQSDTARLAALDLMHSNYMNNPVAQRIVQARMATVSAGLMADTDLVQRYLSIVGDPATGIPGAEGLLDQLHVSRWGFARAEDKTIAQNKYLAGPARSNGRAVTIRPTRPMLSSTSYTPTPIDTGYVHTPLWGVGDYFTGPVTLIRSLKNFHPNGYMRIDTIDRDSVNELRGHLARIPGMKESTRGNILNKYLMTTTEAERLDLLEDVGRIGAAKVAAKYGVSPEIGQDLFKNHMKVRQGEVDRMERYTASLRDPSDVEAGMPLHVDEFTTQNNKIKLSPFTVTRLVNGHTFQDLDLLDKVIRRHGQRFETLRTAAGGTRDWLENAADYTSYLWKFSALFRLGYIPRVLGDDLASQWARVGTAAMALRLGRGVGNAFSNANLWATKDALAAREQNALAGVDYAQSEMKLLDPQIRKLDAHIKGLVASNAAELRRATTRHQLAQQKLQALNPADVSKRAAAIRTHARLRQVQLRTAQMKATAPPSPGKMLAMRSMESQQGHLQRFHDLSQRAAQDYAEQQKKSIQGSKSFEIDGQVFPAAFGGTSGEYHKALVSADESVGNIFSTNKQLIQGNLERSFDHGAKPISAAQDPAEHLKAWTHAINNVIMQDPLQKMIISGRIKDAREATRWLTTDPAGIAYRRRLPKYLREDDIARSQIYEINQYMHTPEIRAKAQEPEGVDPSWLNKAVPDLVDRPDVHIGQMGQSQFRHANALDRVIQRFYNFAATQPANRMSRHPLFNQFYEGHLSRIVKQQKLQGHTGNFTVERVEQMAHSARQLALRDTRALVFDIAHRSDAAAALRFISPFFSATTEAFQRWGRVIVDKPQVAGYAGNFYNSPAYMGHMQDLDGNSIDGEGYAYVPQYALKKDGTPDYSKPLKPLKRMVPKSERYIVTRVPAWFARSPLGKAFNVTEAGGKLALSQNSMDMVTQGDPWFNPGVGPIVQIPVNEFVKDKPHTAELARTLGILPFGVQGGTAFGENPIGRAMTLASPAVVRNAISAMDTSDSRYQQIKMQIMQRSIYDFIQRHDGRAPNESEIGAMQAEVANKTKDYWYFSAVSSFLQPVATMRKDPMQFYRDQYMALRRQNPLTADDEYLKRYGESHFIFAQEISNSSGVPPTMKAVELTKKYRKELAKNPELAPLIIGPEGNGPFSPEAYRYELNNPLTPGGSEMMRTKMSADDALKENQRRLGWAKYTKKMNELGSKLRKAGFKSFADEGAEDFASDKKAWTSLYAEPLYPDGSTNPYYNAEWSKDFFTQDLRKYDRMIPGLSAVAHSDLAKQPGRSDLRMLQQYLGGRKALLGELNALKAEGAPHTLAASANEDLRNQWISFVDGLVEADTKFGDLYHRYLSRDMGVDAEEEANQSATQ